MATRLARRRLRTSYLLVLLAFPLTYGAAALLLPGGPRLRERSGAAHAAPRSAPAVPAAAAHPTPPSARMPPAATPAAVHSAQESQLAALRHLVQTADRPDAVLELLAACATDPAARQMRAATLTALRRYPDDHRVADALTRRACDRQVERVERILALDGLLTQTACLDTTRLSTLLLDDDPLVRQRVRALLERE